MNPTRPWLAVIDMQQIFASPDSGWAVPRFGEILDPVHRLVEAATDRVSFTRFIAPAHPDGAWVRYYQRWPFALQPPDAPMYQLVPAMGQPAPASLDAASFGKWKPELAELVYPAGRLVLAGVSTDCCVLSTALAAADAGVEVRVVAAACAGADDSSHRQALELMSLYSPIIEVVELDDALAELAGPGGARVIISATR